MMGKIQLSVPPDRYLIIVSHRVVIEFGGKRVVHYRVNKRESKRNGLGIMYRNQITSIFFSLSASFDKINLDLIALDFALTSVQVYSRLRYGVSGMRILWTIMFDP